MTAPWARIAGGLAIVALLVAALAYGWGQDAGQSDDPSPSAASSDPSAPVGDTAPASDLPRKVLAISVDGLSVTAIRELGAKGLPTLHRLLAEGASTLNARSAAELSITLPNHTGMVTGRRIDEDHGGHGITWNVDRPDDTVQQATGTDVASIFSVAHERGVHTALFAGKAKFDLFEDSWPTAIDEVLIDGDEAELVAAARADLSAEGPRLTFLHLDPPDAAGHAHGGMSPDYLTAVRTVDRLIGELVADIEADPDLAASTRVVLTADHGFARGRTLHGAEVAENYTIPFLVWGQGVAAGDLYARNPGLRDPGTAKPGYDGPQPIRNLDVADAVLRALNLPLLADAAGTDPPALTW